MFGKKKTVEPPVHVDYNPDRDKILARLHSWDQDNGSKVLWWLAHQREKLREEAKEKR